MTLLNVVSLLALLILSAACGGNNSSSVKFEIVKGFAMVNNDFKGGIVIQGSGITDATYKFQIGLDAGDSANLNLPDGTYKILVVAWENTVQDPFYGTPKCATQTFTVSGASTVEVQTATSTCSSSEFSTSGWSGVNFKNFVVHACGSMEKVSGDPSTIPTALNISVFNYCDNIPDPLLRRKTSAFKVFYDGFNNNSGVLTTLTSKCIDANVSSNFKFPAKIPIKMVFYPDSACAGTPIVNYSFPAGIEGSTIFPKQYATDTANAFLLVPSSPNKTGLGGFHTERPTMRCEKYTGKGCAKIQSMFAGHNYFLDVGEWQRIKIPNVSSCSYTFNGYSTVSNDSPNCRTRNGHTYLLVKSTNAGTQTISYNGVLYYIYFGNSVGSVYPTDGSKERKVYQTLKRVVGYDTSTIGTFDNSLQDDYHWDGKANHGLMSDVSELLSPYYLGGLFMTTGCSATPLSGPISFDMIYHPAYADTPEVVEAVIANPPSGHAPPPFIHHNSGPQQTAPQSGVAYHRRLILRKKLTPPAVNQTFLTLDVVCDSVTSAQQDYAASTTNFRIGEMERSISYADGPYIESRREKLYYNASRVDTARLEYYGELVNKNSSGTNQLKRNMFYRVVKMSDSTNFENKFRISAMEYEARRNNSAFDEMATRFEIDSQYDPLNSSSATAVTHTYKHMATMKLPSTIIGNLLSDSNNFFPEARKTVFYDFMDPSYSFSDRNQQGSIATHPDGNFIHIKRVWNGTDYGNIEVNTFRESITMAAAHNSTTGSVFAAEGFSTAISADGEYAIAAAYDKVNQKIQIYRYTASTNSFSSVLTVTGIFSNPLSSVKVAILNNGNFLVGAIEDGTGDDDLIYFFEGTQSTSTVPSLASWNSPYTSSDDQVLDFSVTSSGTDFYIALTYAEYMMGDTQITFCKWASSSCSPTTLSGTSLGTVNVSRYKNLNIMFNANGTLTISYKDSGSGYVNSTSTSLTPVFGSLTVSADIAANLVAGGLFSTKEVSSYYDSGLRSSLSSYSGWSHSHVPVPYTQPILFKTASKFQMNLSSMQNTNFTSNIFTPAATLTTIDGN